MTQVHVRGLGAVSPAGWGVLPLVKALDGELPVVTREVTPPGWKKPLRVRCVPPPPTRPEFLAHGRLRRTSPISQYAVAAALEALGNDRQTVASGDRRLGIVFCAMCGCVNYSKRFYDETLRDPATASPLVFPETVYNAPASHLAALLGTTAVNYTLVGDPGAFLQGVALAADWLLQQKVDACLVIGAEEFDWLEADAFGLFDQSLIIADGAGAVYLSTEPGPTAEIQLETVTSPHLFTRNQSRAQAAAAMRHEVEVESTSRNTLLCDGLQRIPRIDKEEALVWADWRGPRISPKQVLGEGIVAGAGWQCVAALDKMRANGYSRAVISVVGCNQQAIAAQFSRTHSVIMDAKPHAVENQVG